MNSNHPPLEIRPASLSDCGNLTKLCVRSKQSNGYDQAFMDACEHELTVTAKTLEEGECWVAHRGRELCGCCCLTIGDAPHRGEVSLFFVDPNWQRQGVGSALWQILLERARHHQLNELLLDADPSAVDFYCFLGFEVIGQTASGSIPGRYLPRMRMAAI